MGGGSAAEMQRGNAAWIGSGGWRRHPPIQERMNSPLEMHEVRLRGLHGRVQSNKLNDVTGGADLRAAPRCPALAPVSAEADSVKL
jgi:hypothetical protein